MNTRLNHIYLTAATLLIGVMPQLAYAQKLGDLINSSYNAFTSLQGLIAAMCYILGIYMAVSGVQTMRAAVDAPDKASPVMPAMKLAAAGLLIMTPYAMNVVVRTISGNGVGGNAGPTISDFSKDRSFTAGDGLDHSLGLLVKDIWQPLMENALPFFCYIAGLAFLINGLRKMADAGASGGQGPGFMSMQSVGQFGVAAAFLSGGFVMTVLQQTLFGGNELKIVQFTNVGGTAFGDRANDALWAVFTFLRIVGYIAVIRGLLMLKGVSDGAQNASLSAAMTHMIAGAALANSGGFIDLVQNTLLGGSNAIPFKAG
jgi:hypothetical protein